MKVSEHCCCYCVQSNGGWWWPFFLSLFSITVRVVVLDVSHCKHKYKYTPSIKSPSARQPLIQAYSYLFIFYYSSWVPTEINHLWVLSKLNIIIGGNVNGVRIMEWKKKTLPSTIINTGTHIVCNANRIWNRLNKSWAFSNN